MINKVLGVEPGSTRTNIAMLVLRVGLGILMLVHGIPKMEMLFSGESVQFPSVMGMSATTSLALAVFAEVFCSVLIIAGFATRFAAVPLAITMMVAVFIIHASDPFKMQEMGIHYLLGYLVLIIGGGGKYSLDYLMVRSKFKTYHASIRPEDPTLSIYQ